MNICPVGAELFRAEGRTDRHDKANSRFSQFCECTYKLWGTAVAQWLRCCVTNRKVAVSIPDGVIGIFH